MVKVFEDRFPKGFYKGQETDGYPIDGITKENLDFIKETVLTRRMDYTFAWDGLHGTGKSTACFQKALYLDPSFCLDRVTFTPQQFIEALKDGNKGECIVLDEAIVIGSRFAMSYFNKQIMLIMAQIRSKQLFIHFVMPSFFDLDRILALNRVRMLFHIYTPELGQRGFYRVFFGDYLKDLYLNGKKYYSYYSKENSYGKFSSCFVLPEGERAYERKKQKAIQNLESVKTKSESRFKGQRDTLIKHLKDKYDLTYPQIAEVIKEISDKEVGHIYRGDR